MSSPPRFNEISSIDDNDNSNDNDNDNDNDTFDSTTGAESLEDTTAWCVCRREELKRIDLIGTGRYCQVHREAIYSSERPPQVVAVKSIDPSKILRNLEAFHTAAGEMANEAGILRQVGHENIVELKGLSPEESFDPESWNPEKSPEMFLVFEVLRGTLSGRLKRWRKVPQSGKSRGRSRGLLSPSATRTIRHTTGKSGRRGAIRSSGRSTTAGVVPTGASSVAAAALLEIGLLHRRIEDTATGIARGMRYLHSRGIVLRDLKPANIGYDQEHNSVRLFDFGMAKKVELCEADEQCGSLRYMAPEVMAFGGYTLAVDVYSFGIILYEISSLCPPYARPVANEASPRGCWFRNHKKSRSPAGFSAVRSAGFCESVLNGSLAPAPCLETHVACPAIRGLVADCLRTDPGDRPSFVDITRRLKAIFSRGAGDDCSIGHTSDTGKATTDDCSCS